MDLFFKVRQYVLGELDSMVAAGELPSNLDMTGVTVEPPRDPLHGDMATNAAMVLAKAAKKKPKGNSGKVGKALGFFGHY
jgi:arginyl-tRNA synthetase